jgi:septal ring factor EnvC (AmiA/AmiB activator)
VQVIEATAAAVLSAAILATSGGVVWLVIKLPDRLQEMEAQIAQILQNQGQFGERFREIEKEINNQDKRIIRLELNR